MKLAKEGYPFIVILAAISVGLFALGIFWGGIAATILTLFVTFFFRDPERVFRGKESEVIAPADGKVVLIKNHPEGDVVSIFLSVFNVHVNRSPVSGVITDIHYRPGKFLIAFDERASTENEQNSITIRTGDRAVRFVQIAGLIARRIVCWRKVGETLAAGDRIGLIRFGSRVDVYFPSGSKITASLGQKVKAGQTVIGELT